MTTISNVEQTDPNKFSFYRKVEYSYSDGFCFEKVTIDRETKQIISELVKPDHERVKVLERGIIKSEQNEKTVHDHLLFDDQSVKTWKLE